MNIVEFRTKYPEYSDINDKDLSDKIYTKHYSDMPRGEFDLKFLGSGGGNNVVPVEHPEQKPTWMTPMDEMVSNVPSSFVNTIGNMAKGVVAIPGAVSQGLQNPSPVAPEMAAYDTIKNIANGMKERYGTLEKAKNTLINDPVGVAADISMVYNPVDPTRILTVPLKAGAKALTESLPKWGYKSALKMGTGKNMSIAERNSRALTGLDEMIMPTEGGYNRLKDKVGAIEGQIQPAIDEAAQRGVTVPTTGVANKLNELKDIERMQPSPSGSLKSINEVGDDFFNTHAPMMGDIPIDQAQLIKKGAYKNLKEKYEKVGSAGVEAEKTIARGLKEEVYNALESTHPELKSLGEKEGSLLALRDSLESGVKRIQNAEGLPLRGAIAGSAGNTAMMMASLMELPRVKSALAIALFKAGQKSRKYGGDTARLAGKLPPYAYGIGKYGTQEEN